MSEKLKFMVRNDVEVHRVDNGQQWCTAVSEAGALVISLALNAYYAKNDPSTEGPRAESQTQPATSPFRGCVGAYRVLGPAPDDAYHVYGLLDLVNQTVCYKVRRRDAEGVEYLVATFDTVDAAIKERDRLNAEAKAEQRPQASKTPVNWYSIAGVVNANSKSVKFCVNCQTPDGRLVTVSEWDKREDALAECDRLNAKERAQPQPAAADPVDAPDHYRQGEIECIDAVKAMLGADGFAYWLRGNMVAYLWRLPHKGEAVKDAGKTRNLAERLERLLAE